MTPLKSRMNSRFRQIWDSMPAPSYSILASGVQEGNLTSLSLHFFLAPKLKIKKTKYLLFQN
jgi:hypothetical protein